VFRNVTAFYEAKSAAEREELPRRVDCGTRAFEDYLGKEWYTADAGVRWMPAKATVRMAAPKPGERLYITGYRAEHAGSDFPVRLTVSSDGQRLGERLIPPGQTNFTFDFATSTARQEAMTVTLQVDRTFRPPEDGRDLGLAFGVLELR
jgi:hypothetical protein